MCECKVSIRVACCSITSENNALRKFKGKMSCGVWLQAIYGFLDFVHFDFVIIYLSFFIIHIYIFIFYCIFCFCILDNKPFVMCVLLNFFNHEDNW